VAKFSKARVWDKVSEDGIVIFKDSLICTVYDKSKKPASQNKLNSAAILIQYWLVTDTHIHTYTISIVFCDLLLSSLTYTSSFI